MSARPASWMASVRCTLERLGGRGGGPAASEYGRTDVGFGVTVGDVSTSASKSRSPTGPTFCPQCGERVEVQADVCESCGAPRVGTEAMIRVGETIVATLSEEASRLLGRPSGQGDPSQTMRLGAVGEARPRERIATLDREVVEDESISARPAERRMRPHRRPLIAITVIGAIGFAALTMAMLRPESDVPAVDDSGWIAAEPVLLDAFDGTLGLTDDNKEIVLSLCFQLSRRPNVECRLSYLRELGEFPAREAVLPAFAIDRFEVSNRDWDACVAAEGCSARVLEDCTLFSVARGRELRADVPESMTAPDLPAGCVSYPEAEAYCAWRGGRLPSAEEWERAARSGDDRLQPWGQS